MKLEKGQRMQNNPIELDAMEILEGIRPWVEIESPTTEPDAVNRLVDLVEGEFESIGMQVERMAGRDQRGDHLRARTPWGGDGPGILVLGHLDTVHPLGVLYNQLPLRIDGNRVYGPGIADMKGGAYLALNAVRYLVSKGETTPLPITFVYNSDEEVGSHTSKDLIEETARRAKHVLVCEPGRNGGSVVTARKGSGRFTVSVTGRPSHSGTNHADGRSALTELAHQILKLEAMTDYERGITVNVGVVRGGTRPNVVPGEAMAEVDWRMSTPETAEEMLGKILGLQPITPDVAVVVTGQLNRYPYTKNEAIDRLYRHAKGLAAKIGMDLQDMATGGGSDGNFTAAMGLPTLDALGADGADAHTYNEHIYLDQLVPRQTLLIRLMQTLV
jgi:glutamate carboxypeptidase